VTDERPPALKESEQETPEQDAPVSESEQETPEQETPVSEEEVAPAPVYSKWIVAQLKEELNARGLNIQGRKAELIQRLEQNDLELGAKAAR